MPILFMVKNGNAFADLRTTLFSGEQHVFPENHYHPLPYITITDFQFSNNLSLIYSLPFSLSNEFYRNRDIPKVR